MMNRLTRKAALTVATALTVTGFGLAVAAQPASASYSTCVGLEKKINETYRLWRSATDPDSAVAYHEAYVYYQALYDMSGC